MGNERIATRECTSCVTFVHRCATGKRLRQRVFLPSRRFDRRFGPKQCRKALISASYWAEK